MGTIDILGYILRTIDILSERPWPLGRDNGARPLVERQWRLGRVAGIYIYTY